MDKNFLNLHAIMSHSPSCLNRDDMNMQKSAIFGGKRRVRISSQSLKRAMRWSDYYSQHLGRPSIRTRDLGRLHARCVNALKDQFPAETVTQAIEWLSGKEGLAEKADLQADAVAPWIVSEIAMYCQAIEEHRRNGLDDDRIKRQIERDAGALRTGLISGVDVALSGRMTTSGLMTSIDGALAIAHAITTHSVDADIDWFTAVDDLIEDEGDVGAGHLNTQEFSSGVFYRYASLNLRQLQENLGGAPRENALEIGAHLLYLLATVVPSAKQQSFAAHNVADLVLASFSDIPLSLANAFEKPIRDSRSEGYLKPSALALIRYWHKLQNAYGLDDVAKLFCLVDDVEVEDQAPTLKALQDWVLADAQGGE
jgi:CRISPR system Cascade subunit CasC